MGKLLDAIDDPDLYDRIVAARAKAAELVKEWAAQSSQWTRDPTPEELDGAVEEIIACISEDESYPYVPTESQHVCLVIARNRLFEGCKDLDAPFEIVRLSGGKMLVKPRG